MPTHRMSRGNQCRIVLLGDAGVGKTALAAQFLEGYFPEQHVPTLLDCMSYTEEVDGVDYRVEIVDCASDKEFAAHRSPYIETADVILLVYKVNDRQTLQDLKEHIREVVTVRLGGVNTVPASDLNLEAANGTGSSSESPTCNPNATANNDDRGNSCNNSENDNTRSASEGSTAKKLGDTCSISREDSFGSMSATQLLLRLPYRKEVPIFVVGTHADVAAKAQSGAGKAAAKAVTREQAEKMTEDCLYHVGLRPFASSNADADNQKVSKKIQSVWSSIRKKLDGDDTSNKEKKSKSNSTLATPLSASAVAASEVPRGASRRLPLYELSAKDPKEVWQLFQAAVRLHVLMTEPLRACTSTSSHGYPSDTVSPRSTSKLTSPGLGTHKATSSYGYSTTGNRENSFLGGPAGAHQRHHSRTLSTTSSGKNGDRPLSPRLPAVGSLYNLATLDRAYERHERTLSTISTSGDAILAGGEVPFPAPPEVSATDNANTSRGGPTGALTAASATANDDVPESPRKPLTVDATAAFVSNLETPVASPFTAAKRTPATPIPQDAPDFLAHVPSRSASKASVSKEADDMTNTTAAPSLQATPRAAVAATAVREPAPSGPATPLQADGTLVMCSFSEDDEKPFGDTGRCRTPRGGSKALVPGVRNAGADNGPSSSATSQSESKHDDSAAASLSTQSLLPSARDAARRPTVSYAVATQSSTAGAGQGGGAPQEVAVVSPLLLDGSRSNSTTAKTGTAAPADVYKTPQRREEGTSGFSQREPDGDSLMDCCTIHSPPHCPSTQARRVRDGDADPCGESHDQGHGTTCTSLEGSHRKELSKRPSAGTRLDLDDVASLKSADVVQVKTAPAHNAPFASQGTAPTTPPSHPLLPSGSKPGHARGRGPASLPDENDASQRSNASHSHSPSPKPAKSDARQCTGGECTIM